MTPSLMSDTDFLEIIGLVLSCTSGKSSVEVLESTGSTGSVDDVDPASTGLTGGNDFVDTASWSSDGRRVVVVITSPETDGTGDKLSLVDFEDIRADAVEESASCTTDGRKLVQSLLCICHTGDQTADHILQDCPAFTNLRTQIWPDGISLHQQLYGTSENLKRTVGFIQQTGLSV